MELINSKISVNLFEESQFTSPFIDKPISKKRRVYKDRATKDAGRHDGSRRIELYSSIHEVEFQSRSRRRDRAKDVEYRVREKFIPQSWTGLQARRCEILGLFVHFSFSFFFFFPPFFSTDARCSRRPFDILISATAFESSSSVRRARFFVSKKITKRATISYVN